ncbi:MAG TPA: hypothetical protein VGR02_02870 [Thermoanaerobaculia bacterium]|nr:hypothetical protein [Thermoanaerobaculia bacterium]
MKRSVTEVIRRGFESMLANWPVILLRLGEMLLLAAVTIALIIAILVPVLVSAGLSKIAWDDIDSAQEAVLAFLTANALLIIWILIAISIALLVFVAVHSFVEAGAAQVFLDADRRAGAAAEGPRSRFAAFSMERWMLGGRRGWWTAFWIYNLVWTIAGLILLIPLVLVLGIMLILGDAMASVILGCFVLVVVLFMAVVIAIITNLVAVKAILDSLAYSLNARDALRMAWREVKTDLGRHVAVVAVLMLVAFAVAGVFGSASLGFSFSRSLSWTLLFAPMRILLQLANSAVSAAIANWMLGSFAALVTERRP